MAVSSPRKLVVFNFPPVPHVYSICPFAIKMESFLRINKISHETIYTTETSSQGTMPYCHIGDGEEVSDSNVIIEKLQKEYIVTDASLSPLDSAVSHTIIRMLEEHTAQIGFYFRYGLQAQSFCDCLEILDRFGGPPRKYVDVIIHDQPPVTKDKTQNRGLTRHDDNEIWSFSHKDIQALSDILGTKEFFFGNVPTLADCAAFGHLSQFLWIPMDFPQKKYMKEHCPNLVGFMENFRSKFWPDWQERCKKQPNAKYAESEPKVQC